VARQPRASLAACVVLAVVALGCAPSPSGAGNSLTLTDGSTALTWGDGEYGVVLVADDSEAPEDWAALATEVAANRMTVVAPDPAGASAERLAAAAASLTDGGIERVAYVASGVQGGTLVAALAGSGVAVDQLILVSGDLTGAQLLALGEPPKLFVASDGDAAGAAAAEAMTDGADGEWNDLLLVPGSGQGAQILADDGADELISGVVARLEERR
jgi:hypothetical protein